jgi:PIN domain nuclease of toxin-antitoxin system
MLKAVADTHAVVWYVYGDAHLSGTAKALIEKSAVDGDQIGFSSITLAEVLYLVEKGKVDQRAFDRLMKSIDD